MASLFTRSVLCSCPPVNTTEQPGVVRSTPTEKAELGSQSDPSVISSETQSKLLATSCLHLLLELLWKGKGRKIMDLLEKKFVVDSPNPHPLRWWRFWKCEELLQVSRVHIPSKERTQYCHEEEPLTFCGGWHGTLTSAPTLISGPWLPTASSGPPEFQSLDISSAPASPEDNES